jgi:DNA mismatch endonuclease (patch repair protein)
MVKKPSEKPIKVPRFKRSAGFQTTEERSRHMSKIKGKNTKPELAFRKALTASGIRYRVNYKKLPGNPDISNKTRRFVVFIDGEFWHGYNWKEKKQRIKANREFWIPKIERNMQRDRENNQKLERMGFKVFRFWEHEIKKDLERCLAQVMEHIENDDSPT